MLVVGLGERGAEFPNDDALGESVEIAVAPQRANDLRRLVGPPGGVGRARRRDHSCARLRRRSGKVCGDLRGRLGMRGQFGLLPVANPLAAWPARMGLEEGGERCKGRMRVRAQRRPFQRRSLRGIVGRLGERRQAGGVALVVEDRSRRTARRRRWRERRGGDRRPERRGTEPDRRAALRECPHRRIGRRGWRRSGPPRPAALGRTQSLRLQSEPSQRDEPRRMSTAPRRTILPIARRRRSCAALSARARERRARGRRPGRAPRGLPASAARKA